MVIEALDAHVAVQAVIRRPVLLVQVALPAVEHASVRSELRRRLRVLCRLAKLSFESLVYYALRDARVLKDPRQQHEHIAHHVD